MTVTTDRCALGLKARTGVWVVVTTFDPSPNSYLGLEPVSARLGVPDRPCSALEEQR
jgi:hypothetical protein